MTNPDVLDSSETLTPSVLSGLVEGIRVHAGTSSVSGSPFGAGVVLRVASTKVSAELPARRSNDKARHSTICIYVGQSGRGELRHLGRALGPSQGDLLFIDSDAGFSLETGATHAHAVLQVPKAVLGHRVSSFRGRAGELFDRDDPKTSVVREGLLSLANAGPVLSADERVSAFSAALHLTDILLAARAPGRDDRLYLRAMAAIDRRVAEVTLNPASLARDLGVSRRLLENAFAVKGLTVARCIWERRLARAAEVIAADRARSKTLLEISTDCGFVSAAHFTRSFAAKFGTTPSQYRVAPQ